MRAIYRPRPLEQLERSEWIDFGQATPARRSILNALQPLADATANSDYLFYNPVGGFRHDGNFYRLARFVFLGPASDDEPVRIALFGAVNGDEPEGTRAIVEFLLRLHREPERARGYQIFAYPITNPTGFEDDTPRTRQGHDVQLEMWNGSKQPEVYYIERELGVLQFHGLVNLRTRDDIRIVHAHAGAPTLDESLVRPALEDAEKFLPRPHPGVDGQMFPGTTVVRDRYERGLENPAELNPAPFEIVLEMPGQAPPELLTNATVAMLDRVIAEYRPFLASQQNI